MTATNKRLHISKSHGDSNRCTPCRGKLDQHAMYASHSSPRTSSVRFLRAVPVRDKLSLAPMKSKQAATPEISIGNQRQTGPAIVLGGPIPPPMRQPWSRGKKFQPSGYTTTSAYWAHITSMRSVRSILARGANPSVINRHRWGLQSWRCWLATTHSPTFPTSCLHFPPKGPARSPV
jgi:hypothetical protein